MRIAVFASGGGTNLQSLLDHFNAGTDRGARITLVVSDRERAGALDRAHAAGVQADLIPVAGRALDHVALDTLRALDMHGIDLIVLAGYLRLVPVEVVEKFRGRIINIHPALLPAFGGAGMYGKRVHEAVLAAGCRVSGATVHLVDERYDEGSIIAQWPVPVLDADTADSLAARVLRVEHALFPVAVEAAAARLARGVPAAPGPEGVQGTDGLQGTGRAPGVEAGGETGHDDVFFTLKRAGPTDGLTIDRLFNQ